MSTPAGGFAARAGRLVCFCAPAARITDRATSRQVLRLAAGFALAILSQVLTIGTLPMAGAFMAPEPWMAALPFAAILVGAAVAALPAAFLMDALGRRATFALGAGLGVAGGLTAAWALVHNAFFPLLLGGFWLGMANGFGLFYRHAAAGVAGAGERNAAIAAVFGAGALVGLAAPTVAGFAEGLAAPELFVGTMIAAAVAQLGAFAVALTLPAAAPAPVASRRAVTAPAPVDSRRAVTDWEAVAGATFIGFVAWFVLMLMMVATPLAMAVCGMAPGLVFAGVSWHTMAMYAPALCTASLTERVSPAVIALAGLALIALSMPGFAVGGESVAFNVSLALLGVGWSAAIAGTTFWLHGNGPPSRTVLALHEGLVLSAALLGAIVGGQVVMMDY